MPPKRNARAASSKTMAASAEAEKSEERLFDIGSLPMEDGAGAAVTPRPLSLSNRAGSSAAQESPEGSRRMPRLSPEAAGAASPGSEGGSLADVTLQALLDGAAISSTADTILNAYRSGDVAAAVCGIINLIAKAAGVAEVEVDGSALREDVDVTPLVEELYVRVPADSAAYLVVNKDARYKRFSRALPELFACLVQQSYSADILLEPNFFPVLFQWIIVMSESKLRAFRHTATVALLGFEDGLNQLVAELHTRLSLAQVEREVTTLQGVVNEVIEWRDHLFSQVFHQRLRDVAPEIRLTVFQALKSWIVQSPDVFMTNMYLRYFGMPLYDKKPELRAEALDMILQALAHAPNAYDRMHLFLQYFIERLVEMCNDVDLRCAELAIRVMAMIVRKDGEAPEGSELITNDKVDRVFLLLFDERPTIRAAVGIVLKVFLHCRTTGEESEAEQIEMATKLLCSMCTNLRALYKEEMPGKYLVDALWSPERPPLILTEYKPMIAFAVDASPSDAAVVLCMLAALLNRIQNKLSLGPAPKDDRRRAAKKPSAAVQEKTKQLIVNLSVDVGAVLQGMLVTHHGNAEILAAVTSCVAALDLTAFASQEQTAQLSGLLMELQKVALSLPLMEKESDQEALVHAWVALTATEHPLRSEAQAHLQRTFREVLRQVVKMEAAAAQVKSASRLLAAWGRLHVLSSLVPLQAQLEFVQTALMRHLHNKSPPALLHRITGTAINALLYSACADSSAVAEDEEARRQRAADITSSLFEVLGMDGAGSTEDEAAVLRVRHDVLLALCDLSALNCGDLLPQLKQEKLVTCFLDLFETLCAHLRIAHDDVKTAVAGSSDESTLISFVQARRRFSSIESAQKRAAVGIARLFVLKFLDPSLATRVLTQWTQTSSKSVSDVFKSLFHTLRDRRGDSMELEWAILLEAYKRAAEVGATPASVDALSQIGVKLASMHFLTSDRFYTACPFVVQRAVQFAASTDPLILHAVTPYCSKLSMGDALRLIRHELASEEIFVAATNPYVRAFISAMRRAGRLEENGGSVSPSVKRPRELTLPADGDEGNMLSAIAQSTLQMPTGNTPRGSRKSSGGTAAQTVPAARVVTDDGWHVQPSLTQESQSDVPVSLSLTPPAPHNSANGNASTTRTATAARQGRPVVNVPSSQEIAQAAPADGIAREEVFISTQDFD